MMSGAGKITPFGLLSRTLRPGTPSEARLVWYVVPIRISVPCSDDQQRHALSNNNPNDPSGYLHLETVMKDVRSSSIAIHMRHGQQTTTALCIDSQDGRWFEYLDKPYVRLKEVLGQGERGIESVECPCALHLVILSSAERWWQEVIKGFNNEVLARERQVLETLVLMELSPHHGEITKSLHALVAHVQRYKSELQTALRIIRGLEDTTADHSKCHGVSSQQPMSLPSHLAEIGCLFEGLILVVEELEKKVLRVIQLVRLTYLLPTDRDRVLVPTVPQNLV
ncbi:uncharacterized protein B0H64DRAFT_1026 [Chaetomium fimeti]|uniref:Uncharacterized protein n=1 Tax=Chaetomium fimeti TaxID=1854472 RepID=A0AAE0HP71_9PEZI|nr:hypothetical protein B0H64DRAFT_1026 [Chaetomium fimeti]